MSGHSKWANIKNKKGKTDAAKGKIFTKMAKYIMVASREGGSNPEMNARLREAVLKAKAANMPNDNIDRAIKKGAGELEGAIYEEITYEGYGPGGAALMLQVMTDNRNRTVSEIRHLFTKYNGNLGASGCVAYLFDRKGYFLVKGGQKSEDELMEISLDAGAENIEEYDGNVEITSAPEAFDTLKEKLEGAGLEMLENEISMIPQNTVKLTGKEAQQMLKLMESLEDHDDVQNVYANFDIDESEMQE